MKFLGKSLKTILSLRTTAVRNELFSVPRASYSSKSGSKDSDVKPVKLSRSIIVSASTNHSLPPLVVMHGLFGSKQNWRGVGKALEQKTRRKIINVDARNHGDSPHDSQHTSKHMAADVAYLLEEEKIKKVSVLGHSMGGRSMMYFALKYPDLVEKVVVVDISPVSIPTNFGDMEDIFFAMKNIEVSSSLSMAEGRQVVAKQLNDALNDKETIDFIMLNLKKAEDGRFVWRPNIEGLHENFMQFRATQYFKELPPFTNPVLFIASEHSGFITTNDWPKIQELFPNAEIEWVDTGHLVHFEDPATFIKLVTDFLKR